MPETLGIFVAGDGNFSHLVGLARAAVRQGKQVIVFLTGRGVLFTREPEFEETAGLAEITLCRVSLEEYAGWRGQALPGIPPRNISTQARHADLIDRADRYLVL
ncbi:MAG: hypothetical protein V1816_17355 [Pseudomonadota bacterium]